MPVREYIVTTMEDLGQLERGLVMYEVSFAARPRIIAGFVFTVPARPWDCRLVDGSKIPRQQFRGLVAGMTEAVKKTEMT